MAEQKKVKRNSAEHFRRDAVDLVGKDGKVVDGAPAKGQTYQIRMKKGVDFKGQKAALIDLFLKAYPDCKFVMED